MIIFLKRLIYVCVVPFMAILLVSCGGGGSGADGGKTGTLGIGLTDATTDDYQAIYVTIDEVQVKQGPGNEDEAGWLTVLTPGQTFNLLQLVNGVIADLGIAELEAGQYGQMRLILGELPETPGTNILGNSHPYANYLIDSADTEIELKVPSGYQTGIKIVHGFTIVANGATELILDFDAAKSVIKAGNSGQWLLKPTIKVLETVNNSVSGVVDDGADPIAGALVSAQIYDAGAADTKDKVNIESASVTDENGAYVLFLAPDIYNIVAVKDGFEPGCIEKEATGFIDHIAHFSLSAAASGSASGTVSGLATDDHFATLSFRQMLDCGSGDVEVEVGAVNVGEGGIYSLSLPVGDYQLIMSAEGETTQAIAISIADNTETVQNISF